MRIYDITFSIRKPDPPFELEKSFGISGGDVHEVIRKFTKELNKYLLEYKTRND